MLAKPQLGQRLTAFLSRSLGDKRGNLAITFALALLPIVSSIGCSIDYSMALRIKAKLQSAADAASVAAISQKSPGYVAAMKMMADGEVADAETDAVAILRGNLKNVPGFDNLAPPTATVTKTGLNLASVVEASADVPTLFMKMVYPKMTVAVRSASTMALSPYLDFYLMLDVSGSMGLASTEGEQTRLAAINPDNFKIHAGGCVFACHFTANTACPDYSGSKALNKYNTNGYCLGYGLSRNAGDASKTPVVSCPTPGTDACIQLRADAVGYSVQRLIATALTEQGTINRFRIGLYPFVRYLSQYVPLTSNLSGSADNPGTLSAAAANLVTLLDTGVNANLGSGGTHYENSLPKMSDLISTVGDGSSSNSPLPVVVLVTDGAQNYQYQWGGVFAGDYRAKVIDNALCDKIKKRKIKLAVLYIPYRPIPNPVVFYNDEDFVVNAIIPDIPGALQACASPNFFFTADSPDDITNALNAIFKTSLVKAAIAQ